MAMPEITITTIDLQRLSSLLEMLSLTQREVLHALEDELARANIVPSRKVPPNVVTMNSRLVFEDLTTGVKREATLVYPRDASARSDKISVLAPVGSALLGLHIGETIEWMLPNGRMKRLRVVDILYQPEAAGDYDL